MGGGDLNSKKSWHPNTMKNQERVWKAEQAAAEEKKRISELQRERAEERDRAELNQMVQRNAGSYNDDRLNWMYDKPDKKVQEEDYLLGKSIEQSYGRTEKEEQISIPAVARRVVGSSMLSSGGDTQVDLARKMREDPLLLVKERERAARAALLNNPLQRRRLADLLRKEQVTTPLPTSDEQRKEKTKKKSKSKGKYLDNMLAAKLNALSGGKGINIAKLLDSDGSSSDSSDVSEEKPKKKKKKKTKEGKQEKKSRSQKKSSNSSESDISDDSKHIRNKIKINKKSMYNVDYTSKTESRKRKSESDIEYEKRSKHSEKKTNYEMNTDQKRIRRYSSDETKDRKMPDNRKREKSREDKRQVSQSCYSERDRESDRRRHRSPDQRPNRSEPEKRKKGLSEEERTAKLAAMAAAGAEREEQRGRRVAEQRRAAAEPAPSASRPSAPRASAHEATALPDSLEARIRSNRHYIQRDRHHMNEHFARR